MLCADRSGGISPPPYSSEVQPVKISNLWNKDDSYFKTETKIKEWNYETKNYFTKKIKIGGVDISNERKTPKRFERFRERSRDTYTWQARVTKVNFIKRGQNFFFSFLNFNSACFESRKNIILSSRTRWKKKKTQQKQKKHDWRRKKKVREKKKKVFEKCLF